MKSFIAFILMLTFTAQAICLDKDEKVLGEINSSELRLRLIQRQQHSMTWKIDIGKYNKQKNKWAEFCYAILWGNFKDGKYASMYRKKYDTYYPLNKVTKISKVEVSGIKNKVMKFRITAESGEWLDSVITVFDMSSYILFESAGCSTEQIYSHWTVSPVVYHFDEFITESSITENGVKSVVAKESQSKNLYAKIRKYCTLYKKEKERYLGIFSVNPHKVMTIQCPRSHGLKQFLLNAPFVIYPGYGKFSKSPDTVLHISEGLYSELLSRLSSIK
jgi:hypothetical protein